MTAHIAETSQPHEQCGDNGHTHPVPYHQRTKTHTAVASGNAPVAAVPSSSATVLTAHFTAAPTTPATDSL